jgi:hypothetical protein
LRHNGEWQGRGGNPSLAQTKENKVNTYIVHNLATNEQRTYTTATAVEAVIAAYAQGTRKDYATWTYDQYRELVVTGKKSVAVGDWAVLTGGGR